MIVETLLPQNHDELMEFLNRAFGFDESRNGFLTFLPKLYRREYEPYRYQLAVREHGKLCAAVGMYPVELHAAGERLTCCAVGNMAVDRSCRGKGMMSFLMSEAVLACLYRYDLACLGGQRQRYARFGFEPAGTDYRFTVTKTNIRHCLGSDLPGSLTVREIMPEDTGLLDEMGGLYQRQLFFSERKSERLYDILCSWNYRPYAFMCGAEWIGYCLKKESGVRELMLADPKNFDAALCSMVHAFGDLNLILPSYEKKFLYAANRVSEEYQTEHWEKFLVCRFAKVVAAMLKLKAANEHLCDGEQSVCVHGLGGTEAFTVSVRNGVPSVVSAVEKTVELELSYSEAMEYFFSEFSERRELLPAANRWFPLSLSMRMADHT